MSPIIKELTESIWILLVGMAFVMALLFFLYIMCYAVGLFFRRSEAKAATLEPQPLPTESPTLFEAAPAAIGGEELLPVIAAVVDCLLDGAKYRILSVREISPTQTDWAREGRHSIFSSHRTR